MSHDLSWIDHSFAATPACRRIERVDSRSARFGLGGGRFTIEFEQPQASLAMNMRRMISG